MIRSIKLSAIAAGLSLCCAVATAAPVSITLSQTLTANGQDMSFGFAGLAASNGAGGTITISPSQGQGTLGLDLSGAFPLEDENFVVLFDGVSQGKFSCGGPSNGGATAIAGATDNSGNFNDCQFTLPLSLADAFLADGSLTVAVNFGGDVSTFGHGDIVNVRLDYQTGSPIPEPGTLALSALALLGAGALRRRRS